ncbi:MAG: hypothetical protein Q8K20_11315 [Gemmobacter sp.]|jgi:hypothetical protein|nr:hypothetical protein [Gemmobacter sp.]
MTGHASASLSQLPGLDAPSVEALLGQMADLVLLLSPMQDITAMRAWGSLADKACPDWVGRSFAAILSRDSRGKLETLFNSDLGKAPETVRWRHVNLVCEGGASLPVLVKYFELGEGSDRARVMIARDLRPTVDMQARLQRAYTEMEAAFESRGTVPGASTGALVVSGMMDSLGHRPMGQIVSETVRALETLCVTEALRRSNDDAEAASRLLGIPVEEVRRRARLQ